MAETKQSKKTSPSVLKRQRQNLKAYKRNRANLSEFKTALKKFSVLSAPSDKDVSMTHKAIDKAFTRGVISKNASARRKSWVALTAIAKRQTTSA